VLNEHEIKSLCDKVNLVTYFLSNLLTVMFFTTCLVIVEFLKSEIMERLKIVIREATLV